MALPQVIQEWVEFFQQSKEFSEPFQPQTPDDLIGVEIVYTTSRGLRERGEVIDWHPHPTRGLYLLIDNPYCNFPAWVHHTAFIHYGWEPEPAFVLNADAATFAAAS